MKYSSFFPICFFIGLLLLISACQEKPEIVDIGPPPVQRFSEPFLSTSADENRVECDTITEMSPFVGKWEVTSGYVENFLILYPTIARDTLILNSTNNWFRISCENTFDFFKDTIDFTPSGTYDLITQTQVEYGLWQSEGDSLIRLSDRFRSFFRISENGSWQYDREIAFPIESSDPAWIKMLDIDNMIVKQRGFDVHHICSICDPSEDYFPIFTYSIKRVPE